jgi:hypothetical protein
VGKDKLCGLIRPNVRHGKIATQRSLPHDSNCSLRNSLIDKIAFSGKISDNSYATITQDSAMEPLFPRNSLLIFDPERIPKDRSYVLAELHDSNLLVFRQLLLDADQKYLKPLNPDLNIFKMRLLSEEDKIIATLVEARQIYDQA